MAQPQLTTIAAGQAAKAARNLYYRSYYHRNKGKIKAIQKKYYENNKTQCKQKVKDRYHSDPEFRQRKLLKMAEYRRRMKQAKALALPPS